MEEWRDRVAESRSRWEAIAGCWDDYMGRAGNTYHLELVRPATEKILAVEADQTILDAGCGNGNFSRRLAELGATVVAFDYSETMIERARTRDAKLTNAPEYQVIDATDGARLLALGEQRFDSAVANMMLMDLADVRPLAAALARLLVPAGRFVFSVSHPCFQTPDNRLIYEVDGADGTARRAVQVGRYIKPESHYGLALRHQPVQHIYFHRPLSYLLGLFFEQGFVVESMEEPVFSEPDPPVRRFEWVDLPPVIVVGLRLTQDS